MSPIAKTAQTAVIEKYRRMSSEDMRLMFGELTPGEIRTVRAVLLAIIRDINNEQNKESNS